MKVKKNLFDLFLLLPFDDGADDAAVEEDEDRVVLEKPGVAALAKDVVPEDDLG